MTTTTTKIEKPADWFEKILPERAKDPKRTKGFEGSFSFNILGDGGGEWTAVLRGGDLTLEQGLKEDALFSITMKAEDFVKMMNGELAGQAAFMSGKLKFKGNMGQAMKLQGLLF